MESICKLINLRSLNLSMEYIYILTNSYTIFIRRTPYIYIYIFIDRNQVGNNCRLIGELLQVNRSPLRILSLDCCEIEDEGAAIILEGLKLNTTLKSLYLSNKSIILTNCYWKYISMYIGKNRICKELKSKFEVLALERELKIEIDETRGDEKEKKSMEHSQPKKPIESGLYDCQIIWFDPEVMGEENYSWHEELQSYSKSKIIYSEQADGIIQLVEEPTIGNVIIISCGGKYLEIKKRVEESKQVRMIIIFSFNVENHQHFQEEHIKVWLVTNDFREVIRALQEGWSQYIKHHKFEEIFTEKTFYTMNDYDFIIKNISLLTSAHEGINIFYPLGYEVTFVQRYQALVNELKTLQMDVLPIIKQEDAEEGADMEQRLIELLGDLVPTSILKMYTDNVISRTFNSFIRSGNPVKMNYVKEFAFHLRGSMCLLGSPVTKTNIRLYRGLYLPIHFANSWADNLGKVVLLSQYTSTSAAQEKAMEFIYEGPIIEGTRKVLMQIDLVSDQNIFLDLMKRFTEEKEIYNGIYYPVDIKKYSEYEDEEEEEVFFPPLYPIIIQKITQSTSADKMLIVQCIAPNVLSFGQPRKELCFYTGGKLGDEGIIREAIITKMISLLNMNMLTILDLCKYILYIYNLEYIYSIFVSHIHNFI